MRKRSGLGKDGARLSYIIVAAVLLGAGETNAQEATSPASQSISEPASESVAGAENGTADAAAGPYPGTIAVDTPSAEPARAASEIPRTTRLAEIVVTAQKREEEIQDVPISIAAFSGEQIENLGVQSIQDLAVRTPGLVYDSVANFAIIYIRGVGTDAFLPSADTSVATYVDGVYLPNSYTLAQSLGAVERIEILKGPQGTLFGRNATAGAINVVTSDPADSFEGKVYLSTGNYKRQDAKIYVSGPLLPGVSGSLSGVFNSSDDYYKLTAASPLDRLQRGQDYAFTTKLKWEPIDWFDATLNGFFVNSRGVGTALLPNQEVSTFGRALGANDDARGYRTSVNDDPSAFSETTVGSLILNFHPGPIDIKSITAYQDLDYVALQDFDGSDAPAISFGISPEAKDASSGFAYYLTQEVQFLSNEESPLAEHLSYVGGFYYLDGRTGFDPLFFNVAGLENLNDLSSPVDLPLVDRLLELTGALLPPSGFRAVVTGALTTETTAFFLQTTWHPWDWLGITLGGRQAEEERRVYDATLGGRLFLGESETPIPFVNYPSQTTKQDNFTPKFGIDVRLAEDVLAYVSYQRAYKSGSYNIVNLTSAPTFIKQEEVTTYELGLKSDLFDRSLRFNASVFHNELKDLQSQFVSLTSGGVVNFENVPKAEVQGAEIELLFVGIDGLQLGVSGTYLDGEYKSFPEASGYNDAGFSTQGNDYSGNTIVRNPEFTLAAAITYTLNVPGGTLELGGDWYYNDGYFFDAQNSLEQPQFSVLGARVGYAYEPWNVRLMLFGDNLAEEKYFVYLTQFDTGVAGRLAAPRTYGMRLSWQF